MTAVQLTANELDPLLRIAAETKLLRHFALEKGAFLSGQECDYENEKYFLAQAQIHSLAGFGRAPTKRLAFIKTIAECYERRLMHEAFKNELSLTPKVLQTSNGFAIHFTPVQAEKAASTEAIERHLLQYSFFKDEWKGFELIDCKNINEEQLSFVLSKYSINGFRAGMVIATSKRFPGASFGYFADQAKRIESSPKWTHAISEALDKIEPFLKHAEQTPISALQPIEQGILRWMSEPSYKMEFCKKGSLQILPEASVETQIFNLSQRWNLDFPLYGAYSCSSHLLPLLVVDRIRSTDRNLITGILNNFGLSSKIPRRNPVL